MMLSATAKTFEGVAPAVLAQVLLPALSPIWPLICCVLETRATDTDLVVVICSLLNRLLNSLGTLMTDLFLATIRSLHASFQQQPLKNTACMRVFFQGCKVLRDNQ